MSRTRILVCVATVFAAGYFPALSITGGAEQAGAAPSALGPCTGDLTGTTFTLTASCTTNAEITVPTTVTTIDGGGFTITAEDVTPGSFDGSVLNSATGVTMNVDNLTINSQFQSGPCRAVLNGILFNNASGSVNAVTVTGLTDPNIACAANGTGQGIVDTATSAQTLTITDTAVSDYMKNGIRADGPVTMDVSASTIGPPTSLVGHVAQNGLQYLSGATGTTADSVIYGSGFGNPANAGTAVILFGATNVTLTGNTITGNGTDIGVAVASNSTGVIIDRNQIGRTAPDSPDNFGFGVEVDPGSTATVTCNTFSGWNSDFDPTGVVTSQSLCITTTTVPPGTQSVPYSTTLAAVGGTAPYTWSLASGSLPPGLAISSTGTISGTPTSPGTFSFTIEATDAVSGTATETYTITVASGVQGYWTGAGDGGVFTFGVAAFHGSAASFRLNAPVVGIANTPAGGYWLVAADGGVFSFGAPFFGSMGGKPLRAPIVGMAGTPDGGGYYLVGADGSVYPFGDAVFRGSMEGHHLNQPVVGIAVTPDNGGYNLAAADGGVFTFGDAAFHGSLASKPLNKPVVGVAVDDKTLGYWLVAADGGVFTFDAPFFGSRGGKPLNAPVVGMAAGADDLGYRLTASDGGVFCFGTALFFGSMGGKHLNAPVTGIASIGP